MKVLKKKANIKVICLTLFISVCILGYIFTSHVPKIQSGLLEPTVIKNISMDVQMNEQADMIISEKILSTGSTRNVMSRVYHYLAKYNELLEIESVHVNNQEATQVTQAKEGDRLVYKYEDEGFRQYIDIYYPAEEIVTYTINYRVKGKVKNYVDMQDLDWTFYHIGEDDVPDTMDVVIHFPRPIERNDINLYRHGSIDGTFYVTDKQTVTIHVEDFYDGPSSFVSVRMLFPKKPFIGFATESDEHTYSLERSLEMSWTEFDYYEKNQEKLAKNREATLINKNTKKIAFFTLSLFIVSALLTLLAIQKIYKEYNKKMKVLLPNSGADFIRQHKPNVAAFIITPHTRLEERQFLVSLFNLYVQEIIELVIIEETTRKSKIQITILQDISQVDQHKNFEIDNLDYQLFMWLKTDFGEKTTKGLDEFLQYKIASKSFAETFNKNYKTFINFVHNDYLTYVQEAEALLQKQIMQTLVPMPIYTQIFPFVLIVFALIATSIFIPNNFFIVLLFVIGGIFMISIFNNYVRTYRKKCHEILLTETKNQEITIVRETVLNNFEKLAQNIFSIQMAEDYFIYGVSFGVSLSELEQFYNLVINRYVGMLQNDWHKLTTMKRLMCHYDILKYLQIRLDEITKKVD